MRHSVAEASILEAKAISGADEPNTENDHADFVCQGSA